MALVRTRVHALESGTPVLCCPDSLTFQVRHQSSPLRSKNDCSLVTAGTSPAANVDTGLTTVCLQESSVKSSSVSCFHQS
jgi:hypothetical protein